MVCSLASIVQVVDFIPLFSLLLYCLFRLFWQPFVCGVSFMLYSVRTLNLSEAYLLPRDCDVL